MFYKDLYKQKHVPVIQFQEGLVNKITIKEACSLEALPLEKEIKKVVWSCELTKAPILDGFNFNFIKRC